MGILETLSKLVAPSNDIFGFRDDPTGYMMGGKGIIYTGFPLPDSDERMKRLGYVVKDGNRVIVYDYPGTLHEFQMEVNQNPDLYRSPFGAM